jgi:hypothetical protein
MRTLVERTVRLARLAPDDPELMPVLGPQVSPRKSDAFFHLYILFFAE